MTTHSRWIWLSLVIAAVTPASSVPAPLAAQMLDEVETLAHDGRVAEAREALLLWWDEDWRTASRDERQEALWLRGILTLDPIQAETQFRRLVIEFPGGDWSGRALLRLGRSALLDDDVLAAAGYFGELSRDYPASAARLEATEWIEANQGLIAERRAAAAQRADAEAARLRADSAETAPAGDPPSADVPVLSPVESDPVSIAAVAPSGDHGVQLGAFSTVSRARDLAERVSAAGFEPRLVRVPNSGLVRVRVGNFEDADDAEALYDRVIAAGFDAAVVKDVSLEEPIG